MANILYPKGKEYLLAVLLSGTVKVALLDSTYVYSAAHQFFSSITGQVGTSQTLSGKTATNGVFDATDSQFPSLTGALITQLVAYVDTGNPATSPLFYYANTGHGLPFTPNGRNLNVQYDNGPFKIFSL